MNKIKDIIYDFNDLFVVLLIIALTAGILVWRVDRIMAYPQYLETSSKEQELDFSMEGIDLKPEAVDRNMNDDPDNLEADWDSITSEPAIGDANEADVGDGTKPQPDNNSQGAAQTGETNPTGAAVQTGDSQDGKKEGAEGNEMTDIGLTGGSTPDGTYVTLSEVRFTVPKGASGGKVAQLLADAELVESKQAFINALEKSKKANRIQVGTFTIPAGSTVEDIVDILTK